MAQPNPSAMKSRIITHMNEDHQNSLVLYSRHYSKLPLSYAKTSELADVTLDHMIVDSSFGRCLIPFDPPLKSFAEVRERVVAMHQECLAKLDVDETLIDRYMPPNSLLQWTNLLLCIWCFATFPQRDSLRPESGSLISRIWSIGGLFPGIASLAYKLAPLVLPAMIAIHVAEATHMARGRLRRHSVEMFSNVWWAWVVDNFLEGFGAFQRFDEMVQGKKKDRMSEKKEIGKKQTSH